MSYLRHWKLAAAPFQHPRTTDDVFLGPAIAEAAARCEFAISQRKRLSLLVGPSGCGKTVTLWRLAQQRILKTVNEHPCIVPFSGQSNYDILSNAIQQLDPDSHQEWVNVDQQLLKFSEAVSSYRIVGHHSILIIDEANNLSDSQLELVGRITRIPGLSLIIAISEEGLVDLPRSLLELADFRIALPAWDLGLVADYFDFSISKVGGDPNIFDAQAITRVQELADGAPRRIAQLADLALVSGAVRRLGQISAELIDEVCNEFTFTIGSNFPIFWESQQLNPTILE
ncbi:MAG: AAA family ATPase [Pirellula sp.]|jgi:type II secretory pathway predicted ATPase ExeA|nr:AAA family ATPase [Pirellula sp.]